MCIYILYKILCAYRYTYVGGTSDFSFSPSRNDPSTELSWTYTQDITHISGYAGK